MMLDSVAQLIAVLACAVILVRAENTINHMTRCTPMPVRIAFWLIGIGAVAAIVNVLLGSVPPWPSVFGSAGIAVYLVVERRTWPREQRRPHGDAL